MTCLWDINGCIRAAPFLRSSAIPATPLLFKCRIWPRDGRCLHLQFRSALGRGIRSRSQLEGHATTKTTFSVGPRFIWRTDEANYFLHSLVSLNRVKIDGLNRTSNGIGAILGGGMDLPISKDLAFRLFEADYVWGRHNYADFADPDFPDLRRPASKASACAPVLYSVGVARLQLLPAASCSVQPD